MYNSAIMNVKLKNKGEIMNYTEAREYIKNASKKGSILGIDNIKVYYREYRRNRYQNDSEYKEQQREYQNNYRHNRYQNDTEYRNKIKEYSQRPEVKEQRREQQRNRYQNDPEYREKIKERQRQYHLKKKLVH